MTISWCLIKLLRSILLYMRPLSRRTLGNRLVVDRTREGIPLGEISPFLREEIWADKLHRYVDLVSRREATLSREMSAVLSLVAKELG